MRDLQKPGRSTVYATNGMAATSHPLAAKTAVGILESGGNAVDAAIGAAVLLGICEPQMTGIGGDCFVLLTPPGEDRVIALNGSGRAPKRLSADAMRAAGNTTVPLRGVEAVTIPGAIDAFCRLSADWGKLPLGQSLAPAIRYAEEGVPVAPRVAFDWAHQADALKGRACDVYLLNGQTPKTGQIFRAPRQAEVLRRVATQGRAGFYEGEVAADMVTSLQALGGTHTLDDFAATACDYGTPVVGTYGPLEVLEHPPNGQGTTAILLLNILKHFDIAGMDPFGAERIHIEAEATKLAYDARDRIIADPDHTTRIAHMIAPETAAKLAALIDPHCALPVTRPEIGAVHKDTILISVVDRDRMAVSLIYSIFWGFGAGLASDRFGILFQNRGAGFNLTPGHVNEAAGGKRPMHTIIPGMLKEDGRILGPFGVMGGAYQPTGHARVVSNLTDFGMDVQEALDAPRSFQHGPALQVERGYSDAVRAELVAMGHAVEIPEEPLGGAQIIQIGQDGVLRAGSDPRKDGAALGY
ncbi:MAG: gamma-glutamyltransferase family protein [Rhodobacterales bacterium]|nr:gamma-glutamyltransferase family protein [Rhodobacterales bacterium]